MSCVSYYFVFDGNKLGPGTKVQFNYEFYERNAPGNLFAGYQYKKPSPSIFSHIEYDNGKTVWYFNNCIVDDIVLERDVKEIVIPVPYVIKTDEDRIREKKEQGKTFEYIWLGTIIYIVSMLFITILNERIWGWIAATILYNNYCYEKLSK